MCAILTPGERCSSENVAERAFSFFWLPLPPPPPQLWLPLPLERVAEEVEAARFSDATWHVQGLQISMIRTGSVFRVIYIHRFTKW